MRYMDRSRFWACDFWALFVILTCSCLLSTASGDPPDSDHTRGSLRRLLQYLPCRTFYQILMEKARHNTDACIFGLQVIDTVIPNGSRRLHEVWTRYNDGTLDEIVYEGIREWNTMECIDRAISIGLSCTHHTLGHWPTMDKVKLLLGELQGM